MLLFWVTHLKSNLNVLDQDLIVDAMNALLHYRPVTQELLGEVCTDPEVNCYDIFSAVAGTGVSSTLLNSEKSIYDPGAWP